MLIRYCIHIGIMAIVALGMTATADVVKIGNGQPVVMKQAEQPTRGMSQQQVSKRFGAPRSKHPAVGKPPIIRWDYPSYSVYFEGNYVLHAVDHATP